MLGDAFLNAKLNFGEKIDPRLLIFFYVAFPASFTGQALCRLSASHLSATAGPSCNLAPSSTMFPVVFVVQTKDVGNLPAL
jgi:hypothetical protein